MKKAGDALREARLKKNITIDDVFEGTKIRPSYIESIEASKYDSFHSETTIKGFLRNYAQFLGLSPESIIAVYRREQITTSNLNIKKKWNIKLPMFSVSPSIFVVFASILIVVGVIGFFTYQYVQVSQPPNFAILEPADNFITTRDKVPVRVLRAKDESIELQINNKSITSVDENGNFYTVIDLVDGPNTIIVQATNGFKKTTTKAVTVTKTSQPSQQNKNMNIVIRSQTSKDLNISYSLDDAPSISITIKPGSETPIVAKTKFVINGANNMNNLLQITVNQTVVALLQNTSKQQIVLNPDNSIKITALP